MAVNAEEVQLINERARRESMRWYLIVTMNLARPADATMAMLRGVVEAQYPDVTDLEIRRELDYLEGRELVKLRTDPLGQVRAKLERYGIDIAERTIDCELGIRRPKMGI